MIPDSATIYRYRIKLSAPMQLRGRSITHRSGFLVRLHDSAGNDGWGEAAPLPGFSWESPASCQETIKAMLPALPQNARLWKNGWEVRLSSVSSVTFALEAAWYSYQAACQNTTLATIFGADKQRVIHWNLLVDNLVIPESIPEECSTLKLKVGKSTLKNEIAWVKEIRSLVGDAKHLRLDANRAWNIEEAIAFGKAVSEVNIEYIEEPTQRWQSLLDYESATGVPYALDESLAFIWRKLEGREKRPVPGDTTAACAENIYKHARCCIWKPTLLHGSGIGAALIRGGHTIPLHNIVISGAFESGIGISTLAHYAAAFANGGRAAGLDTYSRLDEDIIDPPLALGKGCCALDNFILTPGRICMDRLEEIWSYSFSSK